MKAGSPDPGCGPVNGPNACEKTKGAFHEPQDDLLGNEQVTHFEVHGPNAFEKRKGALHEPPSRPRRRARPRHRLGGLSSRTRTRTSGFMVPMHAEKTKGAFP